MAVLIMTKLQGGYFCIRIHHFLHQLKSGTSELRDSIPAHPAYYRWHKEWVLTAEEREKRLSKRNHILVQKHDAKAHELPLTLGTNVVVQGKGKKWDRTGHIVEVLPNRQYCICIFDSGRVTLCNWRFIREYIAIAPEVHQPIPSA